MGGNYPPPRFMAPLLAWAFIGKVHLHFVLILGKFAFFSRRLHAQTKIKPQKPITFILEIPVNNQNSCKQKIKNKTCKTWTFSVSMNSERRRKMKQIDGSDSARYKTRSNTAVAKWKTKTKTKTKIFADEDLLFWGYI